MAAPTPAQIRDWVEGATPPKRDTGWYGYCAGLTDRVVAQFTGGSRRFYDSATDARKASGPLNADPSKCPAGGIHYWSYYGTAGDGSVGDWGHVTIDILGGGTATLSATGNAYESWGLNAGLISVASQTGRAGMKYLGWSRTYGTAAPLTITTGSAAGGGAVPFEEDDMPYSEEQLSKIITNAVWGQGGEPAYRPMILNRSSGQGEYPELTLGGLQSRLERESAPRFLKPILDAIAGLVDAVFKRPVRRYGLPDGSSLAGKDTTLEAVLAWSDANNLATRDAVAESVKAALQGVQIGGGASVDEIAAKVLDGMAQRLTS